MTSANVTKYIIKNKNGEFVGEHSEHHLCHSRWHRLYKFTPFKEHTITPIWTDEEEEEHVYETQNLLDFLKNIKITICDVKKFMTHMEKDHEIMKEWVKKFGEQDKELRLRTLNSISYSPL